MRSWYDDTPTSPFFNEEKHCAFKRPSYIGIPVLVSCIVLKGPLSCCLWAVSQLGINSSHFRTKFDLTVRMCTPSSPSFLKGPSFMVLMSFRSLGLPLSGWWWILFITWWCCTVSLLASYTMTGTIGFPWRSWLGLSWLWKWQLIDL